MAGDWIKVERATPDKPEVLRIARELAIDRDTVFGKLMLVWLWFDSNSVDGVVDGAVDADVDALVRHDGFANVMRKVKWLANSPDGIGLSLPNFDRLNGATTKRRALSSRRQARWRNADVDARESTKAPTREENKRNITPIPPTGGFARFWTTWPKHPRKQSRGKCWDVWRRGSFEQQAEQIVEHVEAMKLSIDWRREDGRYIPAPLVYLNQRRWEGAEPGAATSSEEPALYRRESVM
jgi:hypothetical protein